MSVAVAGDIGDPRLLLEGHSGFSAARVSAEALRELGFRVWYDPHRAAYPGHATRTLGRPARLRQP